MAQFESFGASRRKFRQPIPERDQMMITVHQQLDELIDLVVHKATMKKFFSKEIPQISATICSLGEQVLCL